MSHKFDVQVTIAVVTRPTAVTSTTTIVENVFIFIQHRDMLMHTKLVFERR